jgi:peptidyl-prolyl cis-trans isomerase C
MPRLFRSPLLHFLLLGALLYAAQGWRSSGDAELDPEAFRISIDSERMVEMQTTFAEQMGRRPESREVDRMVEAEVEEEILFREAIARGLLERDGGVQTRLIQKMLFLEGNTEIEEASALLSRAIELDLHEGDIVVRRILVQKMRLLGSSLDAAQRPTQADVFAAYQNEREDLRAPDRLSLVHVFLSHDRRGNDVHAEATALRSRIVEDAIAPDEAPREGDPFPLGHHLERRSLRDLERTFGGGFGASAFELELGDWSEPIPSAYGLHLIQTEALEPGQVPPIESVSERLRLQIEQRRRDANLDAMLSQLRARYQVVRPDIGNIPRTPPLERTQEPG